MMSTLNNRPYSQNDFDRAPPLPAPLYNIAMFVLIGGEGGDGGLG